jgi:hypothetical protein
MSKTNCHYLQIDDDIRYHGPCQSPAFSLHCAQECADSVLSTIPKTVWKTVTIYALGRLTRHTLELAAAGKAIYLGDTCPVCSDASKAGA